MNAGGEERIHERWRSSGSIDTMVLTVVYFFVLGLLRNVEFLQTSIAVYHALVLRSVSPGWGDDPKLRSPTSHGRTCRMHVWNTQHHASGVHNIVSN